MWEGTERGLGAQDGLSQLGKRAFLAVNLSTHFPDSLLGKRWTDSIGMSQPDVRLTDFQRIVSELGGFGQPIRRRSISGIGYDETVV